MSRISRNTYNDTTNRKKVEFQIGVPLVDNEPNEAQDILMTELTEGVHASFTSLRNTDSTGSMRYGYVNGTDWRPSAAGSPTVTIGAGVLFVEGYRLVLANNLDTTMSPANLTWGTVGGSDVYGYVYVDITIDEVNSASDATMATPNIGETTVREVLTATWHKAEGASLAAAYATISDLPTVTNSRIWTGNTARVFLFRYHRPAGNVNITQSMLLSLLKTTPAESIMRRPFMKTFRWNFSTSTEADGMVVWNPDQGVLQIGGADFTNNTASGSAQCGMIVRAKDSPDHLIANSVSVVEPATPASGTGDSPVALPNWGVGWTITDGQALGWASSQTNANINNERILKGQSDQSIVYDTSTSAFTGVDSLLVQQLVVQSLQSFQSDPSSFILCTRIGYDLVWYNGQVTRGGAVGSSGNGTNYPAFETPGEHPSEYRAIVCADGNLSHPGSNTLTGSDALERALNFSVAVPGSPSSAIHGGGTYRNIRIFCRGGGTFTFGRGIKRWGATGEVGTTGGSSVVIEGDENTYANKPLLSFFDPLTSSRDAGDLAVFQLNASKVSLRNLRLQQDAASSTYQGGYLLMIFAESVELENCDFDSGVYINADRVRIRGCRFDGGNVASHVNNVGFAATFSSDHPIPQNLGLFPSGTTDETGNTRACDWVVENNYFFSTLTPNGSTGSFIGHAGLILVPFIGGKVLVRDNVFNGLSANLYAFGQVQPSIHIPSPYGKITIRDNEFIGAAGQFKNGNDASVATFPFASHYDGCPLDVPASNSSASSGNIHIVADAYISVTGGRVAGSSLSVEDNFFDMSQIGTVNPSTLRYCFWGACLCVANSTSLTQTGSSGTATTGYHNVFFKNNTLNMALDGPAVWAATDGNGQPLLWGFYSTLVVQDSAPPNNFIWQNIQVEGNTFDLGGGDSSTMTAQKMWRTLLPAGNSTGGTYAWPAGGTGYPTDGSCLIGIVLRNGINSATGRAAHGISISRNVITQRIQASGGYVTGTVACDQTTAPRYWFMPIVLTAGDWYTVTSPSVDSAFNLTSSNVVVAPIIDGNVVIAPIFSATVFPTNPSPYCSGIFAPYCYRAKIHGNNVVLRVETSGGATMTCGIQTGLNDVSGGSYAHINGNTVFAQDGILGTQSDYTSDNMTLGCITGINSVSGSHIPVSTYTSNDNYA